MTEKKAPLSNAEKLKNFRERMRKGGFVEVRLWLPASVAAVVRRYAEGKMKEWSEG